jgi:hypothetical protein
MGLGYMVRIEELLQVAKILECILVVVGSSFEEEYQIVGSVVERVDKVRDAPEDYIWVVGRDSGSSESVQMLFEYLASGSEAAEVCIGLEETRRKDSACLWWCDRNELICGVVYQDSWCFYVWYKRFFQMMLRGIKDICMATGQG